MYLGVDVGGTKTLVAVLSDEGVIVESAKFPTPKKYAEFLTDFEKKLADFENHDFKAGGIGTAGRLDREKGRIVTWTNLGWENVPIRNDLEKLSGCPMVMENDAKMGGLSEAMLVKDKFRRVLYIAIGTGIGIALINDLKIDTNIGDGGGRSLLLDYKGHLTSWEDFAGGHALVQIYGKMAEEITDEATWQSYCRGLTAGLLQLIAISGPEVIIIGGSVGVYFDRFGKILEQELKKYEVPMMEMPAVRGAQRSAEAVVYGCYDLAKQVYGHD